MEPAGAIVGFVCAVGQAAQAAQKLYKFFNGISDAPNHVRTVQDRLFKVHILLLRLNDVVLSLDHDKGDLRASMVPSLNTTVAALESLGTFVRKYEGTSDEKESKDAPKMRMWLRMKWVFREDELKRISTVLEEEMNTLSMSLQALNISIDLETLNSVNSLRSMIETTLHVGEKGNHIVRPVSDKIESMHARFEALEDKIQSIGGYLEKSESGDVSGQLAALIQTTVAASVQQALQSATSWKAIRESNAMSFTSDQSTVIEYESDTGSIPPSDFGDFSDRFHFYHARPSDERLSRTSTSSTSVDRFRRYSRLEASFGTIILFTADSTSNWDMAQANSETDRPLIYELGFTFIPARWMFCTAFTATFAKRKQPGHKNHKLEMNVSSFTTIPCTAEIMQFCRDGDIGGVQRLFSEGKAQPNDRDEYGRTPLHWAAGMGHFKLCEFLISMGADPTISNEFARTPLHWTTMLSCDPSVIRLLIENGSDPEVPNLGGQNPLYYRSLPGPELNKVLDAFIKQDFFEVDINHTDNWGRTPLMWELLSEELENIDSTRALLKKGASVTKTDLQGYTPLHFLLLSCSPKIRKLDSIVLLLHAGADPSAKAGPENITITDIAYFNEVLEMWETALGLCGKSLENIKAEEKKESRAVGTATNPLRGGVSGELKRRTGNNANLITFDEDSELTEARREAIEGIPRRHQYQLFEIKEDELLKLQASKRETRSELSPVVSANGRKKTGGCTKQTARQSYLVRKKKVDTPDVDDKGPRYVEYPAEMLLPERRIGMAPAHVSAAPPVNPASLQEYRNQLNVLEQQNQFRLYAARQEQEASQRHYELHHFPQQQSSMPYSHQSTRSTAHGMSLHLQQSQLPYVIQQNDPVRRTKQNSMAYNAHMSKQQTMDPEKATAVANPYNGFSNGYQWTPNNLQPPGTYHMKSSGEDV